MIANVLVQVMLSSLVAMRTGSWVIAVIRTIYARSRVGATTILRFFCVWVERVL